MSGPTINGVNSAFSGAGAFSFPGVQDPSRSNSVIGSPNVGRPGTVAPSQPGTVAPSQPGAGTSPAQSADVPSQPAINRQLLSEQIPVLTEIASRGRVTMPQPATALKEIKALTKNKTIPKETYSQLQKSSKEFTKCFKALGEMKVADVQAMFNSDKPTKCSKLFTALDQCFGNIDEQLLSLINNPAARSGNIERLQEDCALMYSRLRTAVMSCAEGNLDPKATIASIVNKVASSMSGSAGVLEAVKDEIAPILTGLANAGKQSTDTIQAGRVIADAEKAIVTLERIKQEGVQVGNGRTIPMQSDMDALIATLRNAITNVKQNSVQQLGAGIERAVDRLLISSDLTKKMSNEAKLFFMMDPALFKAMKVIGASPNLIQPGKILEAAQQYSKPADGKPGQSELIKAIRLMNEKIVSNFPAKQLRQLTTRLYYIPRVIEQRAMENVVGPNDNPKQVKAWSIMSSGAKKEVLNLMNTLYSRLFSLDRAGMMEDDLKHLEQMVDVFNGKASGQIRQSDYKAMLSGNLDAGTVMMTYASGLNHHHIDKETCNAQLVKSKQLGSGSANEVQLLTYQGKTPEGENVTYKRVFKPAVEARLGLHTLATSTSMGYNDAQNAIQTNVGAGYIAEKIGAKNVVSATRFAVVNGVPGIMMDHANGIEAADCRKKYASQFARLSPEKQNILRGNLMRELNRLQWADILSGQLDRHEGNYLIDINFKTLEARVTGIDNDVCCGKNMVGMRSIRLPSATFEKVFSGLERSVTQGIKKEMEGTPPEGDGIHLRYDEDACFYAQ